MAVDRQRIYHKRDRLRQLRAFYYAANLNSITRAAEQLGLSQPAVSLHVRELEHELGAMLFDRGGPRIALTEAGKTLYRLVSSLVEGVDDLFLNFAERLQDTTSGDLGVGASHGGAAFVLPSVLKKFRDHFPGIRLHVKRCTVRDGLSLLLADEIELMIGPQEFIPSRAMGDRIVYRPLFSYELVLITPLEHPLAARESVPREEVIVWPTIVPVGGVYRTQSGESVMQEFGLESNVAIEAGGWSTIKHYVEVGLGVAVVPRICVTAKDLLSVIPFTQCLERRSFGMFLRADERLSPIAGRFVELIERYYLDSPLSSPTESAQGVATPGDGS